ncbi:MAG: DUF1294 domain-containing protein [Clostridia bacterium]|nr:DUF1294 domain-containing protein [Clostridia bacterium]
MDGVILYLVVINVVAFLAFGLDKLKAKADAWRIPEKTLLGLAVIGGSVGAILGMRTFRHKTRHKQFSVGLPVILAVQLIIMALLLRG